MSDQTAEPADDEDRDDLEVPVDLPIGEDVLTGRDEGDAKVPDERPA